MLTVFVITIEKEIATMIVTHSEDRRSTRFASYEGTSARTMVASPDNAAALLMGARF